MSCSDLLYLKGQAVNKELGREVIKTLPDTFELAGRNDKLLYWKDIKIGDLSIGYLNVPQEKKALFDKAIESFRRKKK